MAIWLIISAVGIALGILALYERGIYRKPN